MCEDVYRTLASVLATIYGTRGPGQVHEHGSADTGLRKPKTGAAPRRRRTGPRQRHFRESRNKIREIANLSKSDLFRPLLSESGELVFRAGRDPSPLLVRHLGGSADAARCWEVTGV